MANGGHSYNQESSGGENACLTRLWERDGAPQASLGKCAFESHLPFRLLVKHENLWAAVQRQGSVVKGLETRSGRGQVGFAGGHNA